MKTTLRPAPVSTGVKWTTPPSVDLSGTSLKGNAAISLCRALCRNPRIPTYVGQSRTMSLGSNLQTADNRQTGMKRAYSYRSISLLIVPFLTG